MDPQHLHVVGIDGRHHYGGAFLLVQHGDVSVVSMSSGSTTLFYNTLLLASLDRSHQDHGHQDHTPLKCVASFLLLREASEHLRALHHFYHLLSVTSGAKRP